MTASETVASNGHDKALGFIQSMVATLEPENDPTPEARGNVISFTDTKLCSTCGERKSKKLFRWDQWSKDHLKPCCHDCDPVMHEDSRISKTERAILTSMYDQVAVESGMSTISEIQNALKVQAEPHRVCTKCGKDKPLTMFNKSTNGGLYGYRAQCKDCVSSQAAAYNARRRAEKITAANTVGEMHRAAYEQELEATPEQPVTEEPMKLEAVAIPIDAYQSLIELFGMIARANTMLADMFRAALPPDESK
jgi:hypothetical protein